MDAGCEALLRIYIRGAFASALGANRTRLDVEDGVDDPEDDLVGRKLIRGYLAPEFARIRITSFV
jgi:hypothetical protein